ncbi:hypothetical protein M2175_003839 [Bradyrhizobium elkanii]|uniref:hypothetical protein n=1 Tax=Bradyrhizobium TaxID=374 RepID=UPI0021689013|nr:MULTISPECIES: hypothetical protein [Bradyrhizobium]MCS3928808.1 hypothetical protein [Bradyrhizobium elkanii]MCS3969362.1 hypothetical protein [Bradyrhizobium japonicum]
MADVAMMQSHNTITLAEAYDAMLIFLETVWRRLDKPQEEIAFLLAGLRWVDGTPVDPAMWQDWLAAAQSVKEETVKQP